LLIGFIFKNTLGYFCIGLSFENTGLCSGPWFGPQLDYSADHTYRMHPVHDGVMRLFKKQTLTRVVWEAVWVSFVSFKTSQAFLCVFCSSSCKSTRNKSPFTRPLVSGYTRIA